MRNIRNTKSNFGNKSYWRKPSPSGSSFNKRSPNRRTKEKIDVSRFIQKSSSTETVAEIKIVNAFLDFPFCNELQNNLKYKKYITPTPIQDQSMHHILEGKDLIGLANTGTGKTGAFLLPLINKIFNDKSQKTLIIAPTRELVLQIENELRQFSYGMKIFWASCVGGLPIYRQIASLRKNHNIVIGTPGRLKDLSDRKHINLASFNNVVIDEIDRMLDMGFINEITDFLNQLPKTRQSLFFSATMPPKIRDLAHKFLNDPLVVEVKFGHTSANVEQDIVKIHKDLKLDKLHELLKTPEFNKVLIFSETKRDVEKLTVSLVKNGFKADSIHGDKRQAQRQRALKLFKDNNVDILVATDVAARGLDIKNVSHVINYTVPQTYDDYVHRIGRTGRAGNKGKALTFVDSY